MPQNEFFRIGLQRYTFFLNLQIFLHKNTKKIAGRAGNPLLCMLQLESYTEFEAKVVDTCDFKSLVIYTKILFTV